MRRLSPPAFASKELLVQNSLFDTTYSKNALEVSTPEGIFIKDSKI